MIGTKIGIVSSRMPTQSMNMPSTIRIAIMIRMMTIGVERQVGHQRRA